MKVGILSDTHSTYDPRFASYFSCCDEIWHAGDIGDLSVLERLREIAPVHAVAGNIDNNLIRYDCPEQMIFDAAGAKVLLRHIVGRPGKYAFGIPSLLRQERPTILVGGHSHILTVQYDQSFGILFINPGAAGTYGPQTVRTLIRLSITDARPHDLEVIELHSPHH